MKSEPKEYKLMRNACKAVLTLALLCESTAFGFGGLGSMSSTVGSMSSRGGSIKLSSSMDFDLSSESVSSVTKTSIFGDFYSVSRVSDRNLIEIISRKKLELKNEEVIRKYFKEQYKLEGGDLERVTHLARKANVAVVNWINQINEVTNDDLHAAAMAHAADVIGLKQLKFEVILHDLKDKPYRNKFYQDAINTFDYDVNQALGKGSK